MLSLLLHNNLLENLRIHIFSARRQSELNLVNISFKTEPIRFSLTCGSLLFLTILQIFLRVWDLYLLLINLLLFLWFVYLTLLVCLIRLLQDQINLLTILLIIFIFRIFLVFNLLLSSFNLYSIFFTIFVHYL
jgi:hypothetical protein